MENIQFEPDFIFEVSWEVCNKVGGIHTVIATKARTLAETWKDHFVLIGPDLPGGAGANTEFTEDAGLFPTWKQHIASKGLRVRSGRWNIAGNPAVLLVDFTSLFNQKNDIFTDLWIKYRLDSLSGQWDYIEPALFGYAAGIVISCFYECHINATDKVVAQFHEWLSGAGILYLEEHVPQIATVFTTHATVLGRAIAGSGQTADNVTAPVKKAADLNITSKYSLEKLAADTADCFTCVSAITGDECEKLLGVTPDFITPNGFDTAFVPSDAELPAKRAKARQRLLAVASAVLGSNVPDNSFLLLKSGRYEFTNKGIDIFIKSLYQLRKTGSADQQVTGFIFVPAGHTGPVKEIVDRINTHTNSTGHLPPVTHNLINSSADPIMQLLSTHFDEDANVAVVFAPVYLDGKDGIFNMDYYDLLPGFDLGIFPSYYEPWGYTPLESIAFGVPAITTSLAGFGAAITRLPENNSDAVMVIKRDRDNNAGVINDIADYIRKSTARPAAERSAISSKARALSRLFMWDELINTYYMAYDLAIQKSMQRESLYHTKPQVQQAHTGYNLQLNQPVWRDIQVTTDIPPVLRPLADIAGNLWWYWHDPAKALFTLADSICNTRFADRPHLLLPSLDYTSMQALANNTGFINQLNEVSTSFRQEVVLPVNNEPHIAYFSPEYALYPALKIYAGGLGVLAGDYLKTASDLHFNLIAIGLYYRDGYFAQRLSAAGGQLCLPEHLQQDQLPLLPVTDANGAPLVLRLSLPGRVLAARAWKVMVGAIPLYLLDTDLPDNSAEDIRITERLYPADTDIRLKQELLLGIGGIKLLEVLNIKPAIYHINEGHAAFAGLERIGQAMQHEHLDFEEALELVKASTLFTTHTAVPAAIDLYDEVHMRAYFSYLTRDLNIDWDTLMALGRAPGDDSGKFSMLYLAARLSQQINAVSKPHQLVSAALLQPLWKTYSLQESPVTAITNGIHFPTWRFPAWPETTSLNPEAIWQIRRRVKKQLVERLRVLFEGMAFYNHAPAAVTHAIDTLDDTALFIGFARRFAPYKRAELLFTDIQRLSAILHNSTRPVYLLFAGKAHPDDQNGINILQHIVQLSLLPALQGRIFFLEDYDMEIAGLLVQGTDLWLNTPLVPKEACGTSGMKAILNGGLHCSTADGWWAEAYQPGAGWMITGSTPAAPGEWREKQEADNLYDLLEREIVPAFYERNAGGLPVTWLKAVQNSMTNILPRFDMQRTASQYADQYRTLHQRVCLLQNEDYKQLKAFTKWKKDTTDTWNQLHVLSVQVTGGDTAAGYKLGDIFSATIVIYLGTIGAENIGTDVVFSVPGKPDEYLQISPLQLQYVKNNRCTFVLQTTLQHTGVMRYAFRIYPKHPLLKFRQDLPLLMWT